MKGEKKRSERKVERKKQKFLEKVKKKNESNRLRKSKKEENDNFRAFSVFFSNVLHLQISVL